MWMRIALPYVAGGFVKRKFVDHEMYSTTSMLRTIELILGIPPMSQYDAAAMPMWKCFSPTRSYKIQSRPSNINLDEKTPINLLLARKSLKFDLAKRTMRLT